MGRCRACRWWGVAGRCEHQRNDTDTRVSIKIKDGAADAWIETDADFGCVEFDIKSERS